jgi:exosortase E/protease (VPEID-CTERM system)
VAETSSYPVTAVPAGPSLALRGALIFVLALIELPVLAFLYDPLTINASDPLWLAVRAGLRELVPVAIFFGAALAVLLAPQRRTLFADWRMVAEARSWTSWMGANLAGFIILAAATLALNAHGANLAEPPWALFGLWNAGVFGLYYLLAMAMAPVEFLIQMIARQKWLVLLAAGAAGFVAIASEMSQKSWTFLSEATFQVSAFILGLYEKDVFVEPARRLLGADGYIVNIAAACSGYEGIGLVTAFLSIYLWIFRAALRFPNAYLILPIGIAAIWILNSVRIAALISLGAHVSPEIAGAGFHSQAGWMMFLIVTIGIMLATHHIGFFRNETAHASDAAPSSAFREAMFLLAPFLAMTAAGIIAAAFTADGYWLYSLRVIAIGAALVVGWRFYRGLSLPENLRAYAEPALIGAIVGIAWIATDPGRGEASDLGIWLAGVPAGAAVFWIVMRTIGTIILVPIAEELAFRGYLHRKLIADRFEAVSEGAFTWKAFIISSVLFAALHDRWLAGGLAGAAFALALYRSGKVTGAIIAHMSANAVIAFWAIAFGQWSLL